MTAGFFQQHSARVKRRAPSARLQPFVVAVLLVAALLPRPASAAGEPAPELVTVVMVEYRFQPSSIELRQGVSTRLHLVNKGAELHEFTAPEFFAAARVSNPGALANGGQEVVLQPGETKDIDLVPLRSGSFTLTCADHDWEGMTGEIVVR
jgi:uncharacterized cupredoxin-like copper-binding protein